jgi:uncharacterized membrane protein YccF (DUF307 family)
MQLILFVLNVLWFITGGVIAGLAWVLAGVIMAVTIVGLPWARSCFMLASFSFWPFGRDIIARDALYGREDLGTGALGVLGNVIWFVLAGGWPSCTLALQLPMPSPSSAFPLHGNM